MALKQTMQTMWRMTFMASWTALVLVVGCEKQQSEKVADAIQNRQRYGGQEIKMSVEMLIAAAPTNDLSRILHGHVPGWEDANGRIRMLYRHPCEVIREIHGTDERLRLLEWMERRIFDANKHLKHPGDEINYFLCTAEMLDEMSKAIWEASHDEQLIIGLWRRQQRLYASRMAVCTEGLSKAREECQKNLKDSYRIQSRLLHVRTCDLTPEERATADRIKKSDAEQKVKCLEILIGKYQAWDVGTTGRTLGNGTVYRRFKQHSQSNEIKESHTNTSEGALTNGLDIVAAARKQIGVTVKYVSDYRQIPYPGGDVPQEEGVCSDVVVRALRTARGMDLQQLIHEDMSANLAAYPRKWTWGVKRIDANIDHRRVLNQKCYFERQGWDVPISQDAGDYLPGDIVTCLVGAKRNLPHIMIVSDRKNSKGVPLIIHNIGSGTKEANLLFGHTITGHYRLPFTVHYSK